MTNKERLEEIKEEYKWAVESSIATRLADSEIEWLIKQAERTEEAEQQIFSIIENTEKLKNMLKFKIKVLEQQNKRYRTLLERVCQAEDNQFKVFWEACVKVVEEDTAYSIVAEMLEEESE